MPIKINPLSLPYNLKPNNMKAIVNIRTKSNGSLIKEEVFSNKKLALNFIANYSKKTDEMIFGNFSSNGKNFYAKFI